MEALHGDDLLASAAKVGRSRLIKTDPWPEYMRRSTVGGGVDGDSAGEGAVDVDEVDGDEYREVNAERPGFEIRIYYETGRD